MTIKSASPEDTYDHALGSGALTFSWWRSTRNVRGISRDFDVADDWAVEVTAEGGDGNDVTVTVDHAAVMAAARQVIKEVPKYASARLAIECRNLVFDADNADFDAAVGDELLQLIVLGELVYC
jgi:hypothetical protein